MGSEIAKVYGNKVRIRVCGLCWSGDSLLMVRHKLNNLDFWSPPGGGVDFGESMEFTLKREFLEETGLHIIPQKFRFGCEYINEPLHAIELFFEVTNVSGELSTGYDPEIQLVEEVRFLTPEEIRNIPSESVHGIFQKLKDLEHLRQLNGFYTI